MHGSWRESDCRRAGRGRHADDGLRPCLDTPGTLEGLRPWFDAIDVVCAREPVPEAMAKMAIFLRACGFTDASFGFCDRADSIEQIMLTEVVRAGTWRKLGDPGQTAAAFERALALDPANWSLHLDLADLRAEQGSGQGEPKRGSGMILKA